MSNISSRLFSVEDDLQLMLGLLVKTRPSKFKNEYPRKVDVEENLASHEIQARTRLWFDGDLLVAWAYVDDLHNLMWEIESQQVEEVGADIVDWAMTGIRNMPPMEESSKLDASCRDDYFERIEFLERNGFQRTDDITVHMQRDLSDPIPEPKLPDGFGIRSVRGMDEAEAIARLHRAAFDSEYMTTENRLAIMTTSEYDPALDLVVVGPDGTLAAYCTCSVNLEDKIGSTDPVATHPSFQRLGLARALLLTGLRLLKERGMEKAGLGTSGENLAMQKTAESVGFYIVHRIIWFEKRILLST